MSPDDRTIKMDDALKRQLKGKKEDDLQCIHCGSPWFTVHQVQERHRLIRMCRCAKCYEPI